MHHVALASRLSPRDYTQSANFSIRGLCHFVGGRYAEAAEFERRAVELNPDFVSAWRTYAAAAGMAGLPEAAADALSNAKRLQPALSIDWVEKYYQIVKASDRAIYIQGLQAAGPLWPHPLEGHLVIVHALDQVGRFSDQQPNVLPSRAADQVRTAQACAGQGGSSAAVVTLVINSDTWRPNFPSNAESDPAQPRLKCGTPPPMTG